ncbi:MAG: cytochrome c3 family protein [Bacteroidales bacterium]|jgi:hypothetical protein|nr:cytochrome c3 family protein [Bacteroidales bacterium]
MIPPQITRLSIVFAIIIGVFLVLRLILTPVSFGEKGHYRALALIDNMDHEMHYMGNESCQNCHELETEMHASDLHSDLPCEGCHGPAYLHNSKPDSFHLVKPEGRQFCAKCHEQNAARPGDLINQKIIAEHNPEYQCIECHNPHKPWE